MTTKREIMANIDGGINAHIVKNNTIEYWKEDGSRVIRLHHTDILTFNPDNTITFNTDGWETISTKSRMNEYQNKVNIYQKNHKWYVSTKDGDMEYHDGITI